MNFFAVRSIIELAPLASTKRTHLYEERIMLWKAASFEEAIAKAEKETQRYAEAEKRVLSLLQAYHLYDNVAFEEDCVEVFSLLRESDLAPEDYLTSFFDTGDERTQIVEA